MTARVLVAVSLPRHPTTGNALRAPQEASALALALSLTGGAVEVVHAGPDPAGLEVWAGFGARLVYLDTAAPVPALAAHARGAALVLTGSEAALGLGSGLLPYALAEALGWPLMADAQGVVADGGGRWRIETRRSGGARARWEVEGPAVLTVGARGPRLPVPRFAEARTARVDRLAYPAAPAPRPELRPAARRAIPLPPPAEGTYDARIRGLLDRGGSGGGRRLEGKPDGLAEVLLDELRRLGLSGAQDLG